jgi:CheY-like chemotaxis protein
MATVLIVDDEPNIVELVRVTLEDDRLDVVAATSGTEALELAAAPGRPARRPPPRPERAGGLPPPAP